MGEPTYSCKECGKNNERVSANHWKFIKPYYFQVWIRHVYCVSVVSNSQPIDNIVTKWARQEAVAVAIVVTRKPGRVNHSVKNIEWFVLFHLYYQSNYLYSFLCTYVNYAHNCSLGNSIIKMCLIRRCV